MGIDQAQVKAAMCSNQVQGADSVLQRKQTGVIAGRQQSELERALVLWALLCYVLYKTRLEMIKGRPHRVMRLSIASHK